MIYLSTKIPSIEDNVYFVERSIFNENDSISRCTMFKLMRGEVERESRCLEKEEEGKEKRVHSESCSRRIFWYERLTKVNDTGESVYFHFLTV